LSNIKNRLIYGLLILLYTASLFGQGSKNPFDLQYKEPISNEIIRDSLETNRESPLNTATRTQVKSTNPFDIINETPVVASPSRLQNPENTVINKKESKRHIGFLFWVFFGLLLVFSSIYGISRTRLGQVYNSFLNENFLRQAHRYNQGNFSLVYLLLYILAIINIAIFVYLMGIHFGANLPDTFLFLLQLIGLVLLLFGGKHLILWLMGAIFPVNKEISLYSFTMMVFGILLGIFLFLLNITIAYAPNTIARLSVYLALGAIIAIYLFRIVRGLSIGSKHLVLHKFHFFIYLCTVEILPGIILLKVIRNYLEIF